MASTRSRRSAASRPTRSIAPAAIATIFAGVRRRCRCRARGSSTRGERTACSACSTTWRRGCRESRERRCRRLYTSISLDRAAATPNLVAPGLHRLNRIEYANAIRELLAVEVDAAAYLRVDDAT